MYSIKSIFCSLWYYIVTSLEAMERRVVNEQTRSLVSDVYSTSQSVVVTFSVGFILANVKLHLNRIYTASLY
jgi:hypothetical protein